MKKKNSVPGCLKNISKTYRKRFGHFEKILFQNNLGCKVILNT